MKNKIGPVSKGAALSLLTLAFAACGPTYEPEEWQGKVVDGLCDLNLLTSHFYTVTLENESGAQKEVVFQGNKAEKMCFTLSAQPEIGDTWTVINSNPFHNPAERRGHEGVTVTVIKGDKENKAKTPSP